ncbi:hypothetical protein ACWKWU_03565 [Chitinophaga lutea]
MQPIRPMHMTVPAAGKYFRRWGLLFIMLAMGAGQVIAQTCPRKVRKYAISQVPVPTSAVTSAPNAADQNPYTAATVNAVILSTTTQYFAFDATQPSTATAYLKLSRLSGTLAVGASFTIGGYVNAGGGGRTLVGATLNNPTALGLLSGAATIEVAITPGVPFDGIYVQVNGGVSVGYSMQVFEAYYVADATSPINCNGVLDVFTGARAALSVLNAGSTVTFPERSVDTDPNFTTFAHMEMPVGVANTVYEQVIFNTPSVAGDSIRIVLANGGAQPLDLTALGSFSIQPYLGTVVAGPVITSSTPLSLRLLAPGSLISILTAPVPASFDRVELRLDAVAGLLLTMNVYDVARIAKRPTVAYTVSGAPGTDPICITRVGGIQMSVTSTEPCATFNWYSPEPTLIGSGSPFTPAITVPGAYTYYVGAQRTGCSNVETKQSLSFTVVPKAGPPVLTIQPNP